MVNFLSVYKFHWLFLIPIFIVYPPVAWAAKVDVKVDRTTVVEGESFNILFSSNESTDEDPDFSPLTKDFDITNSNKSYSMQFVNGKFNRNSSWTLTLIPKRTGNLQIPAIRFGKNKSAPLRLKVTKASTKATSAASGLFYLEVEASPKTAYIQSQIIYSVRIYHATGIGLNNARLTDLNINDADAIVEKLGDDVTYEKSLNGKRYKVFEKRYVIFPQKVGEIKIDPIVFEGQYPNPRSTGTRNWPGFRSQQSMLTKRLKSKPVNIVVKAPPSTFKGTWLPAKAVSLTESWPDSQPKFKVGEPITRIITLVADGILGSQFSKINNMDIPNIKQYTDQPIVENKNSTDGILGIRRETIAIIPTKTGRYMLPAIEIPWWDVTDDKQKIARLESKEILVTASTQKTDTDIPVSSQNIDSKLTSLASEGEKSDNVSNPPQSPNTIWIMISIVMFISWVLTMIAWWVSGEMKSKKSVKAKNTNDNNIKAIKKQLQVSCKSNNTDSSKDLLIQWGKIQFQNNQINSIGQLSQYCDDPLKMEIRKLNSLMYGKSQQQWAGQPLWNAFVECDKYENRNKATDNVALKPLHYTVAN